MKQMVFVVLDNGEVVGVYDEYNDAEQNASETATITPVIVGQTDDCRVGCNTPSEVVNAMEHELKNLYQPYRCDDDDENEDEWDDDDDDDEDEWDEDEDSDEDTHSLEDMKYELEGKIVISKADAEKLSESMARAIIETMPDLSTDEQYALWQDAMVGFAKDHGIWGVDMRE